MLIQRPGVQRLATQYGVKGSPEFSLSPEIVGVSILDDLTAAGIQDATFPKPAMGIIDVGGGTFRSVAAIVAQAGAGVLIKVRRVFVRVGTAGALQFKMPSAVTGLSASTDKAWTDGRLAGAPSAFIGSKDAVADAAPVILNVRGLTASTIEVVGPWVLGTQEAGGDSLIVETTGTNVGLTFSWDWTEELLTDASA